VASINALQLVGTVYQRRWPTCLHMRQPMTTGLVLIAHWSVRQNKPCMFSSVQLRRMYAP